MTTRPTDAEFEELKRKRDEAVEAVVDACCKERGWDRSKVTFHAQGASGCYCACPTGPCQHIWDGPEVTSNDEDEGFWSSGSCSLCGAVQMFHDIRCSED